MKRIKELLRRGYVLEIWHNGKWNCAASFGSGDEAYSCESRTLEKAIAGAVKMLDGGIMHDLDAAP